MATHLRSSIHLLCIKSSIYKSTIYKICTNLQNLQSTKKNVGLVEKCVGKIFFCPKWILKQHIYPACSHIDFKFGSAIDRIRTCL